MSLLCNRLMMAHELKNRERKGQPFVVLTHLPDSTLKQQHWEEENVNVTLINNQEVRFMAERR